MPARTRRAYTSAARTEAASATRRRILAAARALFNRKGLDAVTIDQVATRARTSASTVYATFKSKDGILRALMRESLFGPSFQSAQTVLDGVSDPVRAVALTATVSRAIYESESSHLGLLRHASGFSPALRRIELEFEQLRYEMQAARVRGLFDAGRARRGVTVEQARRLLWMYTSRDVYRMLVHDGRWTADQYQAWLSRTLLEALVETDR